MVCIKKTSRGFSLIEMLVAFGIATLIVSSVLLRFRAFDSVLGLKGVAYDLALTVRTAQVWSVSAGVDSADGFDTKVGVYVDLNAPQQYILFEDNDDDNIYGASDFVIETYEFKENYFIRDICVDGASCASSVGSYDEISITFRRPEFDAIYCAKPSGAAPCLPLTDTASSVEIEMALASDPNQVFEVQVGATGQIAVVAP